MRIGKGEAGMGILYITVLDHPVRVSRSWMHQCLA